MDRRAFLTLLGAASISVVLPEIWTPPSGLVLATSEIKKICRVSSPADQIFDIILCGKNDRSEIAIFDVIRPDGTKLLALALNTYGGVIRWVAAPGEELWSPLQFVYSGNMTVNVVGRINDQLSFTVIEPSLDQSPVLIPMQPAWESHLVFDRQVVPDVFKGAWNS